MARQVANQIVGTLAVVGVMRNEEAGVLAVARIPRISRLRWCAAWIFLGIKGRAVPLLIVSLLTGCQHAQTLPHRYAYELFPQANSPAKECPDQYPDYVSVDDGTQFFLECWGNTNTVKVSLNE